MDLSTRINTEAIQREALRVLFNHLNDKIIEMRPIWALEDDEFWSSLNRGQSGWTIETINDENFYPGTIPSLVGAEPDKYPNVCTIAYLGSPTNSDDDTGDMYNIRLAIEVMVKSDNEVEINTRIQKTLDAIHLVFMETLENRTLNNTVPGLNSPTKSIGNVFEAREFGSTGDTWFWQGGIIEYNVDKYVNFDK